MLPKNRLRAKRLERLFVFPDAEHPYESNLMKDHTQEFGTTWKKEKKARIPVSAPLEIEPEEMEALKL